MNAYVVTFQLDIDGVDEAINIYEENVIPARKAGQGSRGGYLLINRKTGKGVAISLWNSEEDNEATVSTDNYRAQIKKFQATFIAPSVSLGRYEVCTQG